MGAWQKQTQLLCGEGTVVNRIMPVTAPQNKRCTVLIHGASKYVNTCLGKRDIADVIA